jgi:transposase
MLSQETLQQLQQVDFDRLARQEPNGRRRLRLMALAHFKEGKNCTEVAAALRVTRHAAMRWVQWFTQGGMQRLAGLPHDWSTQRLPKAEEEALRQAVEQLQRQRDGGRVRGEDIRQLLAQQFGVAYSLNGVYHLLKRLDMTWISARAVSPQADPVAQAEFKKKFCPTSASRSTARHSA